MHLGITAAFTQVKEELTEHLDSINQNTTEFEAVSQRFFALESMIEKLTERLDELTATKTITEKIIIPEEKFTLTLREQELFLSLYTASETFSASEYARYLALTEELIHALAHKLIGKGIPVLKETDELGRVSYLLDRNFKELQAKKNLVHINPTVLQQFTMKEDDIDYF